MKLAVKRAIEDRKRKEIWFDRERVEYYFKFASLCKVPDQLQGSVRQILLSDIQCFIASEMLGWRLKKNGRRRYTLTYLHVPRKWGKTVFACTLGLFSMFLKDVINPEVYIGAPDAAKSGLALKYAKNIVNASPALKARLQVKQYQIESKKLNAVFKCIPNVPQDSSNPQFFIVDECHLFSDTVMEDSLFSGQGNRDGNAMKISTAGYNKDYPYYTELEMGKKVLEGEVKADRTAYFLFMLDDEDLENFGNPEVWRKVNPHIGKTVDVDYYESRYEQALNSVLKKLDFLIKQLNVYADSTEQWIPDGIYKQCANEGEIEPGSSVFIGLDLSATRDLSSMTVLGYSEDGRFTQKTEFFMPVNPDKEVRKNGLSFKKWIDEGHITRMNKSTIDYEFIMERIQYYVANYNVIYVCYDPWNSAFIIGKVQELAETLMCRQNLASFNFPMKFFEKLLYEGMIDMGKNPVMFYCVRNVLVKPDAYGNIRPEKKSKDSDEVIDGAISLLNALMGWLDYYTDAEIGSIESALEMLKGNE